MDIADTIFYEILQIDRSSSLITGDFGHDIVFALLIPSVLLILILSEFGKFFAGDSKIAKTLVPIAGLAAIVVGGFYGIIAQFSSMLFVIMLAMFIIVYFKRRIISRGAEGVITGAVTGLAGDEIDRALKRVTPGERKKSIRKIQYLAQQWVTIEEDVGKIVLEADKESTNEKVVKFGGKSASEVVNDEQQRQREILSEMIEIIGMFKFSRKDIEKDVIKHLNSTHKYALLGKLEIAFKIKG